MAVYPQVYADLAVINWIIPRRRFPRVSPGFAAGGIGKATNVRIRPDGVAEAIGMAIEGIESATFLSREQKR